jgi:hypothetical protein
MANGYLNATNPGDDAFPVTPNDGADLAEPVRALLIGVAGGLSVVTLTGMTRTFPSVPVGLFPVGVRRVRATGTTASSIIGIP